MSMNPTVKQIVELLDKVMSTDDMQVLIPAFNRRMKTLREAEIFAAKGKLRVNDRVTVRSIRPHGDWTGTITEIKQKKAVVRQDVTNTNYIVHLDAITKKA